MKIYSNFGSTLRIYLKIVLLINVFRYLKIWQCLVVKLVSSVNKIVDLFQAWNQQNTNVNFKDKDDSSKWLIDMKQNIEHQ